jgi:hypothetical protein
LLREDSDFSELKKNIIIDIVAIQAKTSVGFTEVAIERMISSTRDLFDLSKPLESLKSVYNKSLLEIVHNFRETWQFLASRFPKLNVSYYFATKGDQVHQNVKRKTTDLNALIKNLFSSSEFKLVFLGATELLELARKAPINSYRLTLSENPISATGDVAFVCLVALKDYFKFITDEGGNIVRHIFESNVRDYQGRTQVNEQIQTSLREQGQEDFWWLNNGITILASKATQSGKELTLENPEIVNGLQSSTEKYNYFKSCNTDVEKRNLLVRVVVPKQLESRDRIIKATNSQTSIPPASLRATDKIQRDIEEYLRSFGLFYDRRKNYYKNEGRPVDRIIGIPQMAQAVMAIVLDRPDTARARPSSLIKADEEYQKLFNPRYPIEVYRSCANILKKVEAFLSPLTDDSTAADKNNIKFYVAMYICKEKLKNTKPIVNEIAALAGQNIEDEIVTTAYNEVKTAYRELGGTDQVAKGTEMKTKINSSLTKKFPTINSSTNTI